MSINIKNPKADQMAREIAALTGETLTQAVAVALEERLKRLRRSGGVTVAARLMAIGRDAASRMPGALRSVNYDEFLYDENGMPK